MSEVTRHLDSAGESGGKAAHPGVVATSHPLAVEAALDMLRAGGNAVDAAVTAALVLGVVDPMSCGLGGDCFALVHRPGLEVPRALNGSGRSGRSTDRSAVSEMPQDGARTVTVPGALAGFADLLAEEGTRSVADAIAPAATIAAEGFVVTDVVGRDWARAEPLLQRGHGTDAWLLEGRAPRAGERFCQPQLAATLSSIADNGVDSFYRGELAERIARTCTELGGWISEADLAEHESEWVEPLEGNYRGHPVFELPPNTQGIVALEALGILDDYPLGDVDEVERHHLMIEALKLAFADARAHVGDPQRMERVAESLLDADYLEAQRNRIGNRAAAPPGPGSRPGDTVYVAVVDERGGVCSLIHSIYAHFGAQIVVPGTGLTLQNRGALFCLEPGHANELGPRRRPYHTIIPAMVFREGMPWLVFGVVGGFQQPQAQLQIISRMVDLGQSPQEAVAAPRFRWIDGEGVRFEDGFEASIVEGLSHRGHRVVERDAHGGFGGAQMVCVDRHGGAIVGASDPRKDGRTGRTDEERSR